MFDVVLAGLRIAFFVAAVVVGTMCAVEWAVRTRRIHPFSALARTSRRVMAPIIAPVERTIVRAGGVPSSAPWWTLIGLIVAGVLLLSMLEFARDEVSGVYWAVHSGPRGVVRLIVSWVFAIFYIALVVRVISSWIRVNPFGRIVRWSYAITEPLLAPLRRFLVFGMVDVSPIAAWLLMSWFIQPLVMRLL